MKYVVLGASAAGINGALELRKRDAAAEIILVSLDTAIYSRCILHHYMEGIRTLERLSFVSRDTLEKKNITWYKGKKVVGIDTAKKKVILSDQSEISYDKLLIATGSNSFMPTIEGIKGAKNLCGFHDFADCEKVLAEVKANTHVVILGSGLVGVDVAAGLIGKSNSITMVDLRKHMLAIQLDAQTAKAYQTAFAEHGVKQIYNVGIAKVVQSETGRITTVILTDGQKIPCDLLVVAAGVRANVEFLRDSDVVTDRCGLVIDDTGKTNRDDIYGAGDVTGRNPIWSVAVKEGIIAAANMVGDKRHMSDFFASKSTMNFFGIPTMSLGIHELPDDTYQQEVFGDDLGNYKKVIYKDGNIHGALLQGDLSYAGVLTQLIRRKIDISKVKKELFKIDYSDFFHLKENFEFTYGHEEAE
jgi:NAD(P)H-nitrite reductase large subunit